MPIRSRTIAEARRLRQQRLAELRRDHVVRPAIYVGAGTCGLGAGAQATMDAVRAYLDSHEIQADVVKTGCIGLCSLEPIVDIQLPGRTRVSFQQVTAEKVPQLLDEVFAGRLPEAMVLGQHRHATLTAWDDVPYLDEHPVLRPADPLGPGQLRPDRSGARSTNTSPAAAMRPCGRP